MISAGTLGAGALIFAYFAGAKFVGYSAFCRWAIEPQLHKAEGILPAIPAAWQAGLVRTLISVCIGLTLGVGFWHIPWVLQNNAAGDTIFYSLLVPVRVFEWWLLLRLIYKKFRLSRWQQTALIAGGVVISFIFDVVGFFTELMLPGGIHIC